jgi:hypothetical protein
MKNKQYNSQYSKYILKDKENVYIICVQYSAQGVARAFHGYSDNQIGKAGGYGYDKESTVLCEAIEHLTGKRIDASGVGVQSVKTLVSEQGMKLYDFSDLYRLVLKDN